jgi:hypothetical protein
MRAKYNKHTLKEEEEEEEEKCMFISICKID